MKALSIHPAYAMCIVTGVKTVECRSWSTNYRGDILICSTAKKMHDTIPSHALGIVTLKNVVPFTRGHLKPALMQPADFAKGLYAWELENPRLIKPIPIKGKLSLWEYDGEVEIIPLAEDDDEGGEAFLEQYWKPLYI